MPCDQIEGQRRLSIMVEVGPVHGNDNLPARSDQMGNPVCETVPDIDVLIAEQAIDLLDRVLGHQTSGLCQCLTDHRHRQRCAGHDTQCRPGQRFNPLGMQVVPINFANERADATLLCCKNLGRITL